MLGFGHVRTSMQLSQRQRAARDREKEKRAVSTLVQDIQRFMKLSNSPFSFCCLTVLLRSERLDALVGAQSLFPGPLVC